jgi:lysophospholipase L1-like esterase
VPEETDIVLLELGANDMLRGVSPELTERNLAAMIERLQEREIEVMLIGMMAAPNLGATIATHSTASIRAWRKATMAALSIFPGRGGHPGRPAAR